MKKRVLFLITVVVLFVAGGLFHTRLNAAGSYLGVQKGLIHLAYVEYKDSDTVTITCGYGECNGHYWESTDPSDQDMTSLTTAEDFHYIYIDDANSIYADPIIIDSTTEPAWSNSKLGWYNGNDRCIGVVWSPSGSATIMEYIITPDLRLVTKNLGEYIKSVLSSGNPDGNYRFLECSGYSPVNAKTILITGSNDDSNDTCFVEIRTVDAVYSRLFANSYNCTAGVSGWLESPRNGSRDLYWCGNDNDNNYFSIHIDGYQIER